MGQLKGLGGEVKESVLFYWLFFSFFVCVFFLGGRGGLLLLPICFVVGRKGKTLKMQGEKKKKNGILCAGKKCEAKKKIFF